jgi:UDP-N-acetylglucosamine:LPS N-acetylglucosamine transferase
MADGTVNILFFSRGRGSGHAVPDLALADELHRHDENLAITWASYGTGYETLKAHGCDVIDLHLPEENPFVETNLAAFKLISATAPHLVISHEEFAVAPASRSLGIPVVFLTDFFLPAKHLWMQCLSCADEIIFIDDHSIFPVPAELVSTTTYVGPIVRPFSYCLSDRSRARRELGIDLDTCLILGLPGKWFTEARAPVFDLILAAYRRLHVKKKNLVYIAGKDHPSLCFRAAAFPDVVVKEVDWAIDRWMVACDFAITKATRKTTIELFSLGVPSISISPSLNRIDDLRVRSIPTNTALQTSSLDVVTLVDTMESVLRASKGVPARPGPRSAGVSTSARLIAERCRGLRLAPKR